MVASPEMSNIFQFMELRAPFSPEEKALRQNYIRDDLVVLPAEKPDPEKMAGQDVQPNQNVKSARMDADLQSPDSLSAIGRLVYEHVFCGSEGDLMQAVLKLLTAYDLPCPGQDPARVFGKSISIFELERQAHININDGALYYLLPERLEQIDGLNLFPELLRAFEVMERARTNFKLPQLEKELATVFGGRTLSDVVFHNGAYTNEYREAKRTLFDTLYLLYIMRRRASVNLEHVIEGLRVLHVIEALAVDGLIETLMIERLSLFDGLLRIVLQVLVRLGLIGGSVNAVPLSQANRTMLEALFPELQGRNGKDVFTSLPLIQSETDFIAYFTATPVIHPIFARLLRYRHPFNDLKPIGIGDLKVVKQWLIAYLPGEISHIENVLKGEFKDRIHRRLEKTEETFSFSSEYKEESQKDSQTTERFELKREAENVVKTELGVGANANLTYTSGGGMIVANVGANFSYKRDATEQSKISGTLWREALTKAVERVEKRTAEQRSVTKLFETEETNKHGFDNSKGKEHISGIYRWLDKKYKAQLFNYGKRMMFEFVIPEPAAFFIESRLRAFEATLEVPQSPKIPTLKTVALDFQPSAIVEPYFEELRKKYDLKEFTFPERTRQVEFINTATGDDYFKEKDIGGSTWFAKTYNCKINAKGYTLTRLSVTGYLDFYGSGETNAWEQNTLEISVNGQTLSPRLIDETRDNHWVLNPSETFLPATDLPLETDVPLTIGSLDLNHQYLTVRGVISLGAQTLLDWQTQVFNHVKSIEQQKIDKENQEVQLAYNSQMATYRNRIDELKAAAVNDLLQGQSEAFNREIIRTELKKHCLTLLTKEFDADPSDDLIEPIDAVKPVSDRFNYHKFEVDEDLAAAQPQTTFSIDVETKTIDYPSIVLDEAKKKGRYIQFLEQAFEWQQLAYIFYPYFWATRPKWIEMMNHSDDADPNMTAFLQSGSVKVLIAVTTAYEAAILHFLATRQPWEGGPAPVIGDPLFIPLYEEVRKRQDDLYNAVPEGEPWTFTLPTSLVYLDDAGAKLPTFPDIPN